ncbi:MAG: hypothetical protein EOM59_10765 [Clostridia bacterium]|nr:hypothetical protein [Clostridia bacterium]
MASAIGTIKDSQRTAVSDASSGNYQTLEERRKNAMMSSLTSNKVGQIKKTSFGDVLNHSIYATEYNTERRRLGLPEYGTPGHSKMISSSPQPTTVNPEQPVVERKKKPEPIIRSGIGVLYNRGLLGKQSGRGERLG